MGDCVLAGGIWAILLKEGLYAMQEELQRILVELDAKVVAQIFRNESDEVSLIL